MKNLILCGGFGTRLWPLSRKLMPKQFLKLFENKSLFQLTAERNAEFCDGFIVSVNEEQYFLAFDQMEELTLDNQQVADYGSRFLLETEGKNTAPAIAFAALTSNKDDILFVTPSDHLIKEKDSYKKAVKTAEKLAKEGYLVTFGIEPTNPNTGYGYIQAKPKDDELVMDVELFHEKPNLKTAQQYIENNLKFNIQNSTLFLWNSGMFMFKAGVFLDELKKHSPDVYDACVDVYNKHIKQMSTQNSQLANQILRITNMQDIPNISVDYAVMEKSDKIKAVKSEFDWNDVGSFDSLMNEIESQETMESVEIDSKDNFYYGSKDKVIAAIGLEDFIVVDTKDALLISKKGQTQKVKNIVEQLKRNSQALSTITNHYIVHRPWGTYEMLVKGEGYKIKRIIVKPGKRLSLQKHFHRNEHWIVVSGTAEVQVGDKKFLVRENESTYIKMGEIHRLGNPGKIPVILIEAQVGRYLEEDDIVRLKDDYYRD